MYPMFYPIPLWFPKLPTNCDLPPTLYAIMNSMANFDKEEKTKIKNLALTTHEEIFDFDYPLTTNITKEDFEVMILNHFIMRRIGYDTFTSFQIALNVKLNEIMPVYNKMFDMLQGWNLFNDGEIITRTTQEANAINDVTTTNNTNTSNNHVDGMTTSNTESENVSDRRYSNTPQNDLQNVKDGKYITDYNYDKNNTEDNNTTSTYSNGNSTDTLNGTVTKNISDNGSTNETISRTPSDKIRIYNEFLQNKTNIYSMIFRDLDSLFYGLV